MAQFDRYDIADAHFWWNMEHHGGQWSKEYARQCKIGRYFKPSRLANGPESGNAKKIYNDLCVKNSCTHELIDLSE